MKRIKYSNIAIISVLLFLLLIPSFIITWGIEEGTFKNEGLYHVFELIFLFLRFPLLTLFDSIIYYLGPLGFFLGLFFNCFFYGYLFELVRVYITKR